MKIFLDKFDLSCYFVFCKAERPEQNGKEVAGMAAKRKSNYKHTLGPSEKLLLIVAIINVITAIIDLIKVIIA